MNIIVVGLSHNTAPVEIRERLAVPDSRMGDALARLATYPGIRESVLLSTCNRVEVYAVVDEAETGYASIQQFLADTHLALSAEDLMPHLYWHCDDRAIRHLFRVASSLDSMIVGEPQILGQVKDAFGLALGHKASGVILNKLVQKSISVAKRVRTETRIAETAVSVGYAAVELAKKIFSDLRDKTVLLVGAGEMAKLAARHFVNCGVRRVLITTRDPHSAVELAKQFNGVPIPFEQFRREMATADIVLCSTGASHYLIRTEDVQRAVWERFNRPIFLIDISVPGNIEPEAKDIDNAFLFNIDDLEMRVEENREERRREAGKAERLVEDEVGVMLDWLKTLEVTPTIVALRRRAEEIKRHEIERVVGRLQLSAQERNAMEGLASAIVNKLLHGPLVTLKSEAHSAHGLMFIEAARRLFHLDKEGTGARAEEAGDERGAEPRDTPEHTHADPAARRPKAGRPE